MRCLRIIFAMITENRIVSFCTDKWVFRQSGGGLQLIGVCAFRDMKLGADYI